MTDGELPAYVRDGLRRQDLGALEDARDLVDELIAERRAELDADDTHPAQHNQQTELDEVGDDSKGYVIKWQQCGRDNCESCPHGPYKYAVPEWKSLGPVSPDHPDAPPRPDTDSDDADADA